MYHRITIRLFTLKNINIFNSKCLALAVLNKKRGKISEEPNDNSAIHKSFGRSHSNANGI